MIRKTVSLSALLLAGSAFIAGPVYAQDTSATDEYGLNVIVVTAQKSEENLQDVPISVDVIGGETIDRLALTDLSDLSKNLPNFQVQKSGAGNLISIRGIGSGGNRGFEQSVGMFIDGIFAGREEQFAIPFFDLERVEVLKGTQSILFGKNTIAGAVNITTAKPTEDFEAALTSYYEFEYGETRASGYVSGPISDTLRARLALRLSNSDGFLYNTLEDREEIANDDVVGRVSIEWEPSSDLIVQAKYEHAETKRAGSPFQLVDFATFGGLFRSFDPDIDSDLDLRTSSGIFNSNFSKINSDNASLEINYFLGDFKLTSITGYSYFKSRSTDDSDFSPVPLIGYSQSQRFEQFSQEVRLESPQSDQFEYTLGAFYQDASYFNDPRFDVNSTLIGPFDTTTKRVFDQDSEVISAFGEATVHIGERFRVIGGLRYSHEEKSALKSNTILVFGTDIVQTNPAIIGFTNVAFGSVNYTANLERSESDFSPALTLQYDFGDDEMLYVKGTQGFKSGGFDVTDQGGVNLEYEGEKATSFEAGIKSRFADGRAELNAAIFHTKFEDLQVSALSGIAFITTNAAEAVTQGVEVNGRWQITPSLMFTGSAAYTDAKYKNYTSAPCNAEQEANFTGTGPCLADLSGKPLFSAPKWSANLSLQHITDFNNGWSLESSAGLNYRSDHFVSTDLSRESLQQGYGTVDLGFTLNGEDRRWSIGLLSRNLFNVRAKSYQVNVPVFNGARSALVIQPRTIAVTGTARF